MSDSRRGFRLDTGFIDHFNTQLVITFNYNVIANFHTTRAHAKFFLSFSVFTRCFMVTAPTMAMPVLPRSSSV
jgi:hypothetical protein